ncbi:hypothetical protein AAAC51_26350 [Priestia megaterium]
METGELECRRKAEFPCSGEMRRMWRTPVAKAAMHHFSGEPLPHQLANAPRAHL